MGKGKGRIAAKVLLTVMLIVIIYISLPSINNLINNPPSVVNYSVPERMNFTFERTISIQAIGTYTLNITIPTNNTLQSVYVKDESGYSKDIVRIYNRTVWSYDLQNDAEVKIVYEGTTYAKVWRINNSLDVDAIPQDLKDQYNHREYIRAYNFTSHQYENIYVIDPAPFRDLTEKLTENDTNVVEKLRTIYNVIVDNFQYNSERSGLPRTAVQTWEARNGDCDELSFVFVSMARSIGIPAWIEYGPLYTGNSWVSHGWVGTVVPTPQGVEMVTIDLTIEVGGENFGRGFLIKPPDRLLEWRDDGNSEHLTSYYTFIRGNYRDLQVTQSVKIIKAEKSGIIVISSEEHQIPSWLMLLLIIIITVAVIVIIIKL